jgi:hypothetical protein
MDCLAQLRNALSGGHRGDQLAQGQGYLHRALWQLFQRMRNPEGDQEQ